MFHSSLLTRKNIEMCNFHIVCATVVGDIIICHYTIMSSGAVFG